MISCLKYLTGLEYWPEELQRGDDDKIYFQFCKSKQKGKSLAEVPGLSRKWQENGQLWMVNKGECIQIVIMTNSD
jgi:hypothetical protein